ncbi:MAG: toxic anion resistance protein [Lachnospiraceae bacterium]|jgi:uncharacterized protein YaaN involved in tellurite resistance
MSDKIKLELHPDVPVIDFEKPAPVAEITTPEVTVDIEGAGYMESINLTDEEKQMVSDFATQIDITDTSIMLSYGAAAQKKIADFSDNALEGVRNKDLGKVGDAITSLVVELKGLSIDEEPRGLARLFRRAGNRLATLKARYDKAENNVDNIVNVLQDHQNRLTADMVMLDKMYETNMVYFKELTMYILAGKEKLELEKATTLVELQKKAEKTGLAEDAQAAKDFADLINRFEKKLYDLELTRTVSIQMAPQIRLVQGNDTLMAEKIQSTINNTIPLWKNQMLLAISMEHSEEAMKAQKAVTDLTNELIQKNAETLKEGTVQIATESERGIVDVETVQKANDLLIETLDEVIRIQEEGRQKRQAAEQQLGIMEAQLKHKLLEIKANAQGPTVGV